MRNRHSESLELKKKTHSHLTSTLASMLLSRVQLVSGMIVALSLMFVTYHVMHQILKTRQVTISTGSVATIWLTCV